MVSWHESPSFKAGNSEGQKESDFSKKLVFFRPRIILTLFNKIFPETFAGFKIKPYLCIVNPERHAGGGDPM